MCIQPLIVVPAPVTSQFSIPDHESPIIAGSDVTLTCTVEFSDD